MKGTKWALGFVMLVFGILLTTQFKVEQQRILGDTTRMRTDEIAQELKSLKEQLDTLEAERARLAAENARLKQAQGGNVNSPAPSGEELTPLEMLAGTTEVQGPGLIVTLQETPEALAQKLPLKDEDVRRVVNELVVAGAEAIAVNGQRVNSATGIRDVGQRIMVYQMMTTSPIEIAAIGDAKLMEAALRLRGGVGDILKGYGIKMTIQKNESIRLPAFTSPPGYRYAKPVK